MMNMKNTRARRGARLSVIALAVMLVLGTMSVFAYDYTMDVSAGRGSIGDEKTVKCTKAEAVTVDPEKNEITIDGATVTVTPPDPDHFVIGLRDAGHDNSPLLTSEVTLADRNEDTHLVVAYGLKSDMVQYTINYVEAGTGNVLLPAETHYGVANSKPVVSYKYVESYLPDAYNRTGTLVKGGTNVFTFYYYEVDAEGNVITVVNNVAGGGAAGAGGAGGAGAGGAAGGANIDDGAVPLDGGQPQDVVDIDDDGTPTTDNPGEGDGEGDGSDIDDGKTPTAGGGINWPAVGGGAGAVALIAAIAALLAKRKRDAEDDDDEDEEDAE